MCDELWNGYNDVIKNYNNIFMIENREVDEYLYNFIIDIDENDIDKIEERYILLDMFSPYISLYYIIYHLREFMDNVIEEINYYYNECGYTDKEIDEIYNSNDEDNFLYNELIDLSWSIVCLDNILNRVKTLITEFGDDDDVIRLLAAARLDFHCSIVDGDIGGGNDDDKYIYDDINEEVRTLLSEEEKEDIFNKGGEDYLIEKIREREEMEYMDSNCWKGIVISAYLPSEEDNINDNEIGGIYSICIDYDKDIIEDNKSSIKDDIKRIVNKIIRDMMDIYSDLEDENYREKHHISSIILPIISNINKYL